MKIISTSLKKTKEYEDVKVLIVCGRLLEEFDKKQVSVVCIMRNIAAESRVLFSQFVGRAVRKISESDETKVLLFSHIRYEQKENFIVMNSYNSTFNQAKKIILLPNSQLMTK